MAKDNNDNKDIKDGEDAKDYVKDRQTYGKNDHNEDDYVDSDYAQAYA